MDLRVTAIDITDIRNLFEDSLYVKIILFQLITKSG